MTYGEITVGEKSPMGCVAVAHDGHNTLAILTKSTRRQRRAAHSSLQKPFQDGHSRTLTA
jgi:hypothetical protein